MMERAAALALVQERIPNANLVNHCVATEIIMAALARHFGLGDADVERWSLAGLLHDLDYAETSEDFERHGVLTAELLKAVKLTVGTLAEIESKHLDAEQAQALLRGKAAPALMEVNKCPDFVMDHGHYYAWFDQMTDDDKDALIELLKTF